MIFLGVASQLTSCGVKGDPIPYVGTSPQEAQSAEQSKNTTPEVKPVGTKARKENR